MSKELNHDINVLMSDIFGEPYGDVSMLSERQDGSLVLRTGHSGEWIAFKPCNLSENRQ